MRMFPRHWRRFSLAIPFLMALLACSCGGTTTTVATVPQASATTSSGTPTTGTPAAGDTPAPATPIPASVTNCNQIGTFASAGAASAGSGFSDITFPADSFSVSAGNYSDTYAFTTYQFKLINACSNGANVGAIQSFFAARLTTGGWHTSTTFPFQGNPTRQCGDPYCWRNGSTPVRYVGLENVQTSGSVAVYTLRVSTAPAPSASMVVRQNTTLTGGANQTVSVSCQSNEQMLSGGFLAHNPGGDPPSNATFTPNASYPSAANTWTVRSGALGYALNLTAYALCLHANYSVGLQIAHNHISISSTQDSQANCGSGMTPTGGGFSIAPGGDLGAVESSLGLSNGWQVGFHTGSASTADVWAICATKNIHAFAQHLTPFNIGPNAIGQYAQACSGGTLTSGGYFASGYLNDYGSYPNGSATNWLTNVWNESLSTTFAASNAVLCNTLSPTF
ncbi:MAG: hypothetical protein H0X24_05240 [Ktedonobacterales bacterium]|nr:hypothetical protein [Ktedonobacterales bacterium]